MFSQEWIEHRGLIKAIRRSNPDAVIVGGGEHPTSIPEFILRDCPEIDYIVMGEGEITFLELCYRIFHDKNTRDVGGTSFLDDNGTYVFNGLSNRIAHINEIPRPAWHLINVENYFIDNWSMGISMGRNMPILATRGCPYQCTFCSSPSMWTTRYTMRTTTEVVDEIEFLIEQYQANSIDFFDLTAIVKRDWILAFCAELKKRNINITWQLPSGTRSEALDQETLQEIYDTGCKLLVYAPESGSAETLSKIKKKLKLPRLIDSVSHAAAIGHTIKLNFIIGFPHERYRNVFQTIWTVFILALKGASDCHIAIFAPYPGSELYDELRKEGKIERPNDQYFKGLFVIFDYTVLKSYCRHISAPPLLILRLFGMMIFYVVAYASHPRRLIRIIRSVQKERFQAGNLIEQRIFDIIVRRRITAQKDKVETANVVKLPQK